MAEKRKEKKLTNNDLYSVLQGIRNINDYNNNPDIKPEMKLYGKKFSYALAKNQKELENEGLYLETILKHSDKYSEYDKKRMELRKKHAKKDKNGTELIMNNMFVLENQKKYDKEAEDLQTEYKDEIETHEKHIEKFNESLLDEADFKFHLLEEKHLPEPILPNQLKGIFEMIKEDT